jgi:hypothetical protein
MNHDSEYRYTPAPAPGRAPSTRIASSAATGSSARAPSTSRSASPASPPILLTRLPRRQTPPTPWMKESQMTNLSHINLTRITGIMQKSAQTSAAA